MRALGVFVEVVFDEVGYGKDGSNEETCAEEMTFENLGKNARLLGSMVVGCERFPRFHGAVGVIGTFGVVGMEGMMRVLGTRFS